MLFVTSLPVDALPVKTSTDQKCFPPNALGVFPTLHVASIEGCTRSHTHTNPFFLWHLLLTHIFTLKQTEMMIRGSATEHLFVYSWVHWRKCRREPIIKKASSKKFVLTLEETGALITVKILEDFFLNHVICIRTYDMKRVQQWCITYSR